MLSQDAASAISNSDYKDKVDKDYRMMIWKLGNLYTLIRIESNSVELKSI